MRRMASIRKATLDELDELSALAVCSKAYWGYSAEFMAACREELSVTPRLLREGEVFVLGSHRERVGFYSLEWCDDDEAELGHLFVDPRYIGQGHGRRLLAHASERVRATARSRLVIQGDPHAERFYEAAGARRVGQRPSESIPGRMLPLFVLDVEGGRPATTAG